MAIRDIKGISSPFRAGSTGIPEPAYGEDAIDASIRQLLLTPRGKRVMRPDLGTAAYEYIFDKMSNIVKAMIIDQTRRLITQYEPRVRVLSVTVNDLEDVNGFGVLIVYQVNEETRQIEQNFTEDQLVPL